MTYSLTWTDGKEYGVKFEPGPGFVLVSIKPTAPAELESLVREEVRKWVENFALVFDHPECMLDDPGLKSLPPCLHLVRGPEAVVAAPVIEKVIDFPQLPARSCLELDCACGGVFTAAVKSRPCSVCECGHVLLNHPPPPRYA
jgi:hypothetical protein